MNSTLKTRSKYLQNTPIPFQENNWQPRLWSRSLFPIRTIRSELNTAISSASSSSRILKERKPLLKANITISQARRFQCCHPISIRTRSLLVINRLSLKLNSSTSAMARGKTNRKSNLTKCYKRTAWLLKLNKFRQFINIVRRIPSMKPLMETINLRAPKAINP